MTVAADSMTRPSWGDQVAAERVRGVYKSATVGVLSALFATGILCWILIRTDPALSGRALGWLGATTAIAICQLALSWAYWRVKPAARSPAATISRTRARMGSPADNPLSTNSP